MQPAFPSAPTLAQQSSSAGAGAAVRYKTTVLAPNDGLPLWLRSGIGLGYAAVGAAHLIVGALIGAAEKPLVLAAVSVVLLINLYSLDIWRTRLSQWWRGIGPMPAPHKGSAPCGCARAHLQSVLYSNHNMQGGAR